MSHSAAESSTREALVRAAIRVIGSRGLRGSTLRAIAADAGLTHGMIVHHFGTRANLVRAAMEYSVARSLVGAMPDTIGARRPRLGEHVREVAADPDGIVAFQREVLNEAGRDPALHSIAVEMWRQFDSAVAAQLADAGVTDSDAVILFGAAVEGLVRRQMDIGSAAGVTGALALLDRLVEQAGVPGAPS
ncbi:TetR/AcrR family transcriptional regulator [Microbacterium sp. F51-2R]|uniref:TetR/AcrR family transcriptional regulator n=1 Tax=Microbacterium sp. F51-2R TaxID=3445777 RepID=UPI003FA12C77